MSTNKIQLVSKLPGKVQQKQGVCHKCGLPIYIKKKYIKAKRRIMEIQIFHHEKKNPSK
jgi:hypothetical protein